MSYARPALGVTETHDPSYIARQSLTRTADPTVAPWLNDSALWYIQMSGTDGIPLDRTFADGPWILSEGPFPRTVNLDRLHSSQLPPDGKSRMGLGTWMMSMVTGAMTGVPMCIVLGVVDGSPILYAVTAEEYRKLPPNYFLTVAIPNNAQSTPTTLANLRVSWGPVVPGGTYAQGIVNPDGGGIWYPAPSNPWAGSWTNVFPTSIPGSIWPVYPSPATPSPTGPQNVPADTAGISTTDILLIIAGCVGAYMYLKHEGVFRPNAKVQHEWDKATRDWETDRSNHDFILAQQWRERDPERGPRKKRSHYPAHRHHRDYPLVDTYKDKDDMRGLLYRLHDHEAAERTTR